MNSVTVQIVLEGLIALVPLHGGSDPAMGNRMAALVIDATQKPPGLVETLEGATERWEQDGRPRKKGSLLELAEGENFCFQPHEAMIRFPTTSRECLGNSGGSACDYENLECVCTLDRHEVSILTDAEPPMRAMLTAEPRGLPFDNSPESAGDFGYAANLSRLGHRLDRRFLDDPEPPAGLQARFTFPFDSVLACSLALRRDERSDHVHELEFRPRGSESSAGDMSQ
ncbi:MAG: hypothetical protein AAF368_15225, partial [Planctomycetota bacterium]